MPLPRPLSRTHAVRPGLALRRPATAARRTPRAAALLLATLTANGAWAAPDAPDSGHPIHVHRIGTGDVDRMKAGITLMVDACRVIKGLPPGTPFKMPSDDDLAKLAVSEDDEYFDGANHATYRTTRMIAPDPRSGHCELKVFHERHAWAGQACGSGTLGSTTLMLPLTDMEHPEPPRPTVEAQPASRDGCGRKARVYDIEGLPTEDAGLGQRCVWHADVLAKSVRALGVTAKGHDPDGPAADFCLYQKQPAYVFNGHRQTVVLKSSGGRPEDALNQVTGLPAGHLNTRLVDFSDGRPIAPERFTAAAVRRFVEQAQITTVGISQ